MRKYLLIATGVAVLAGGGVAMAQMPPGGGPGGPGGPPPNGQHGPDDHWGKWAMMRHMHHHDDGGAFFRFRRGDAEIDIKCPATDNVQACVTAASTLIDKVGSMQQQPKTQ